MGGGGIVTVVIVVDAAAKIIVVVDATKIVVVVVAVMKKKGAYLVPRNDETPFPVMARKGQHDCQRNVIGDVSDDGGEGV